VALVGGKNPGSWYSDKEILEIRTKAFEEAKKYCAGLERKVERYREALQEIIQRPTSERNPDGDEQAAHSMQLIAREALDG
jgi:hypothetical protein